MYLKYILFFLMALAFSASMSWLSNVDGYEWVAVPNFLIMFAAVIMIPARFAKERELIAFKKAKKAEEFSKYIEYSAAGKKPFAVVSGAGDATITSDGYPKPGRLLHPTPENFEEYCAEWCRYLGYQDAVKTQNTRDGGIDIWASNMIAQVKFQANPVGVGPIRELNGVKRGSQETLFFALNGFTPEARREASEIGMTLITVRPVEGTIDIMA